MLTAAPIKFVKHVDILKLGLGGSRITELENRVTEHDVKKPS